MESKYDKFSEYLIVSIEHSDDFPGAPIQTKNSSKFPVTTIKKDAQGNQFVCITDKKSNLASDNKNEQLNKFLNDFSMLCKKHQINPLSNKKNFSNQQEINNGEYIKYEFYITPDDFHELLMRESPFYSGYNFGYSIVNLAHPDDNLLKENVICLFPIQVLDDNYMLIRNTGCNFSAVLSTQLSVLLQKHCPEKYKQSIHGHWVSPVINTAGFEYHHLNAAALAFTELTPEQIESYKGGSSMIILNYSPEYLKPMSLETKKIYSASAVIPSELEQLMSFEVPMSSYLEKLIEVMQNVVNKREYLTPDDIEEINRGIKDLNHVKEVISCSTTQHFKLSLQEVQSTDEESQTESARPRS